MKSNGQADDITGMIYDQSGNEIRQIKSFLGMGNFLHFSEKGKTYYLICENIKGQSKRFDLPATVNQGYGLVVSQTKNVLHITTIQPAESLQNDEMYLLAHTRGKIHFSIPWDFEKNQVVLQTEKLPTGVLHLVLFNAGLNPVSERLVFINNQDKCEVTFRFDQENYASRSLVKNQLIFTDREGEPLSGSFSVSVTSDKEVMTDSTSNILTHFLLTSDLYGTIENPAYFFRNNYQSSFALDLLMRIQGWRRYDFTELAHGRFSHPSTPIELGDEISGSVKNVLTGKPVEKIEVIVITNKGDFNIAQTDKEGRFHINVSEFPDSTWFVVSAEPKRGITRMDLIPDRETFPVKTLLSTPPIEVDMDLFAKYVEKTEQINNQKNSMHTISLPEVAVTAVRKPQRRSIYYDSSQSNSAITEENLEKLQGTDIFTLLHRFPGVDVSGNSIRIRGARFAPLLLVDNVIMDIGYLNRINVFDISQIDVMKGAESAIFGTRGANGAIVIFTKEGRNIPAREIPPFHIKTLFPLGYQQPSEFYAPKYDTPEKRNEQISDLRTTIHWQPVVLTDSLGVASFEFYTADEPTSYTIIIEGIANDGSIIRKEGKLWRREE